MRCDRRNLGVKDVTRQPYHYALIDTSFQIHLAIKEIFFFYTNIFCTSSAKTFKNIFKIVIVKYPTLFHTQHVKPWLLLTCIYLNMGVCAIVKIYVTMKMCYLLYAKLEHLPYCCSYFIRTDINGCLEMDHSHCYI